MHQVLKRRAGSYKLTAAAYDIEDQAATVTDPLEAVVRDGGGTEVYSAVPGVVAGTLVLAVPFAELPHLDEYSIEWAGKIGGQDEVWSTEFALVGGVILTIAEIRRVDRTFADETKYPDATLATVRDAIEECAEKNGMCAFRPRGRRVKLSGTGRTRLVLPDMDLREVYSVTVDGTALTTTELAALRMDGNVLWREDGWPGGFANTSVHYAYGYDRVPGPVRRGALALAREYVGPNNLPARATATQVNDLYYRITVAGRDGATGVPDFDAAIAQFGRERPVNG